MGVPILGLEEVCIQGQVVECIQALAVDSTQALAGECTPDLEVVYIPVLVEGYTLAPVVDFTPGLEVGCIPGQGSPIRAIFPLGMFL